MRCGCHGYGKQTQVSLFIPTLRINITEQRLHPDNGKEVVHYEHHQQDTGGRGGGRGGGKVEVGGGGGGWR